MSMHEVVTLLRIRDEATAVLQRYISTLREAQAQVDATLVGLKEMRNAMAPNAQALAMQREALGLTAREADIRAGIGAQQVKQSEAMLAARRAALELTREELAAQRAIAATMPGGGGGRGRWSSAANRLGTDSMWAGAGILGAAAYATQKAIDFNQVALETDVALGGYGRSPARRAADIRSLQAAAMRGSEATGFFSAQEILEGLKVAASSGARPLVDRMGMDVFTKIAPSLAQYMDIVGRLKGEAPEQAAMEAIRSAHMFGAYTPEAITRTLNAQAALALLMPDKMSRALNVAAYAVPSGVNLAGVPQADILSLIATADQSGLGSGRAGARLKDYIEAIAVHQSKAREAAKRELQLGGALDQHGSLDLMKSFQILQADAKRMGPQAFRDAVRTAFGAPGAIVAAMFGDESKQKMFEANRSVIANAVQHGDLSTIQDVMKGGPGGQEALLMARFKNDMLELGKYGLPIAVHFLDEINPKLKQFGSWLDAHPGEAAKLFDDIVHVGEGLLIFGAALKALSLISGTISAVRTLYGAITTVGSVASQVGPQVGGVATALRGLAGAGAAFLASPLGKLFVLGAVEFGTTSFMPQDQARKDLVTSYGYDYWRYLKGRHRGSNPYSFDPSSGDLTPAAFRAHQTLRAHGIPASGYHGGGGFGPAVRTPLHASSNHPTTVHVARVEINFPNVKDGPGARDAMEDLFSHPMHLLYTSAPGTHTHPNIPVALTVGRR